MPHSAPHVLDPRDPQARSDLALWLAVQRSYALSPGPAFAALRAGADPRSLPDRLPERPPGDAAPPERALRLLARSGAALIPCVSPAYPERLARIADPAPVLGVIGDVDALSAPAIAVVGARAATSYGRSVARSLAGELARAGLVIVSGLAHGVDAEAHRAALAAGGRTVAVQACGPEQVYPAAHRRLAAEIAGQGAVVCELPPGARPRRAYFPLRNRLIAGLCRAIVVVEARERSGSLTTARHAASQGAEVFAVPGPITAPTSAGTHRLLCEGAWPALSGAQVLEALSLPGHPPAPAAREPEAASLSPQARTLLARLSRAPATRDELLRALPGTPDLPLLLMELELAGRVARDRDGRFRVEA